jgi:hypothetical protein
VNPQLSCAEALQLLASADSGQQAPYDFQQFKAREALVRRRRQSLRLLPGRATALAATLSAVLVGAALWRYVGVVPAPAEPPTVKRIAAQDPSDPSDSSEQVRAGHQAVRVELEQRIALIDAMLSESRVSGERADSLRALEEGRSTLVDSLQRVAYAQQLVEP